MKLQNLLMILPLATATLAFANPTTESNKGSTFHFSTKVERVVEKDLMRAEVYSRKSGKNLGELKKSVSENLNKVLELAKKQSGIDVSADGISNFADYDNKGKVIGWVAEGGISLQSKNFDAIANVLENLGDNVAIRYVDFSVSPEKLASLEDEMTVEIIKQFQHKAELIQKSLNAQKYQLSDVHLNTPNGENHRPEPRFYMAEAKMASSSADSIPLEAGKATISANASGKVVFE